MCFREVRNPEARTVVYFHGNGETVNDHLPDPAESWLDLGVNLAIVTYRGYGDSTGVPQFAAMLEDVEDIFAALALPEERLIVAGRSLGSLYATEFAYRHPGVAGLILESGIADVLERMLLRVHPTELGCTRAQLRQSVDECFNQQRKLSAYPGPVLLMHTRNDGLVASLHAERNHEWVAGPKRLIMFERGDHNTILYENRSQYFQELKSFLSELVDAKPGDQQA